MALLADTQYYGFNLPGAYHRIANTRIAKVRENGEETGLYIEAFYLFITVEVSSVKGAAPLFSFERKLPIDVNSAIGAPVEYAYTQLRTLPEFTGAIDAL